MAKKKRSKTSAPKSVPNTAQLRISEYEVTSEPLIEPKYQRLPEEVKSRLEQLHMIAQTKPRIAIPELEALIETYPTIPKLYNYLSIAYSTAGETEKMEEVILQNYRLNPDYLFARLNYAEICLHRKEYDKIADIFEHKFDLKLLYPRRKRFHISEITGFMGVIGQYFYYTGEREVAENAYRLLQQIAPRNPYTKRLKRLLYPGFFQRIFRSSE
jgi:tetratricopeptide (TPR) repeat protein